MKKRLKREFSFLLAVVMLFTMLMPANIISFAAASSIVIGDDTGAEITTKQTIQEYDTRQLTYTVTGEQPEGSRVEWSSNLPLLADVDDKGVVKGYDYSKAAIINLWIDENIRVLPIVGDSMANSILSAINNSGVDLEDMNNDMIVAIVRGIAGDTLADSLKNALDNMNVEITATLLDASGKKLASDTVQFVVQKNMLADAIPTGVHITNRNVVPTTVAVGATVQLRGAVTPVRLHRNVKWVMGGNPTDIESGRHATVTKDGLVKFTSPGKVSIRVGIENDIAFVSSITFNVRDPKDYPVESFDIVGEANVSEGSTTQLAIGNVIPSGAYAGDVKWETSDPTIAVVDQTGVVTGLDGGDGLTEFSKQVKITATAGGVSKTIDVKVNRSGVTGEISAVEIAGPHAVATGSVTQYKANVLPNRLNNNKSVVRKWGIVDLQTEEITWASESVIAENTYITIDKLGKLTAKMSGQARIVSKVSFNGKELQTTHDVMVGKAITDFTITGDNKIAEGETTQLTISNILPADYDQEILKTAVWTVENPDVAYVDQNGLVKGLDSLGKSPFDKAKTNVVVTIGGIAKSFQVEVGKKGVFTQYTGGRIIGSDYVIKDFPIEYSAVHSPKRLKNSRQYWGVNKDDGSAPWVADADFGSGNIVNKFDGNMSNSCLEVKAAIDGSATTGKMVGLQAGETTIHTYMANGLTAYIDLEKKIQVVEIEPKSISITPPTVSEYIEGSAKLDLTGMEVKLTYNREDIAEYYGEEVANKYTEEQLSVPVTDYTVSEINQSVLDTTQYILVTVNRAGKAYNAVFPITVKSKQVTSIELENPQYEYREGVTKLNLDGLKVKANYSNAPSEYVTDYVVNEGEFDPNVLDTEQKITVTYTHANKSASAQFPVIVYGIPVVSVDNANYDGNWTNENIVFNLSSTHILEGVKFYYKTDSNQTPVLVDGNTLTIDKNVNDKYYFKAVNSHGIESEYTKAYSVKRDDVSPTFDLEQTIADITNQSYMVNIKNLVIGESGVKSVTLNDNDITNEPNGFIVEQNGSYNVKVTANNGLSLSKTIEINNIDKQIPVIDDVKVESVNNNTIKKIINKASFGIFFKDDVQVTITAHDDGVAGLDRVEYRFVDENGNPVTQEWSIYDSQNKPVQKSNFKGYVEARAIDKATNLSDVVRTDGYVIDVVSPTDLQINATYNGKDYNSKDWVAGDVNIKLSSNAFSGIREYQYSIDNGEWQSVESDMVIASQEGTHIYKFRALSNSGLYSAMTEYIVKIDRQVPVIRVNFEGSFGKWTGESVKFSLSTEENSLSGITYYYNNGNGWTEISTNEVLEIYDNVNATYVFKAVNGAGTQSYQSDSYKVMMDIVVPTITLTPTVTGPTKNPYTVDIKTTCGNAGIKSVTMNGTDITGLSNVTVSANGTYVFSVLGNNGKMQTKCLQIDNFYVSERPVLQIMVNGTIGKLTNESVVFTLNCPNATPNMKYYYSYDGIWNLMKDNTLIIDETCQRTYKFKAVNEDGLESYESLGYDVNIELPPVDYTALESALSSVAQFDKADYSEESYVALQNMYDKYVGMLQGDYSQTEVDAATIEVLTAINSLEAYFNLNVYAQNGSVDVSIDDVQANGKSQSVLYGQKVTLTASANDGYVFDGWYETVTKRIFSTESTYTFTMTSNMNLQARFIKVNSSSLIFANKTGQIIKIIDKTRDEWNAVSSIKDLAPDVPFSYGYTNGRWVYDDAQVMAKLKVGQNVTILPQYDSLDIEKPVAPLPNGDKPVVDLYYSLSAQQNIGSFVMAYGVPEGCKVEARGVAFYFKKANEFNPDGFILTLNNKMLTSKFTQSNDENINVVNVKHFTADYNWCARAYISYYDKNGDLKTVYSNQINVVDLKEVK